MKARPTSLGLSKKLNLFILCVLSAFITHAQTPTHNKTPLQSTNVNGNAFPFGNSVTITSNGLKWQTIYPFASLSQSVTFGQLINKIYIRSLNTPTAASPLTAGSSTTINNLIIKLGVINETSFTNATFLTGLTQCAQYSTITLNPPTVAGEWIEIPLQTPFAVNVTSGSIVVEMSMTTKAANTGFGTSFTSVSNRRLATATAGATTATVGTLSNVWTDLGFEINTGTLCTTPIEQPTGFTTPTTGITQINASFTAATNNPDNYLVVRYPAGSVATNPVDGTTYVAGSSLGAGIVVSNSSSTSFTNTGLTGGTTYDYYVYSFNSSCSNGPLYLTSNPLMGTVTTLSCSPSFQATTFTTSSIGITQINASFTTAIGNPSNYLVVRYVSGSAITVPINGTSYTIGSSLGNGIIVSNTNATSFSNSGLLGSTSYDYYIYSFNSICGNPYYLTINALVGSVTTLPCPPLNQPTAFITSTITPIQVNASFTAATLNSSNYLVVRYISGSISTDPINGISYTIGASLGSGVVVSNTNATSFSNSGLLGSTSYDYYIYSFNSSCGIGPLYLTSNPLVESVTTLSCTPTDPPSDIIPQFFSATQINASFTASISSPSNYLVVRYPHLSLITAPVNGTSYVIGSSLGDGVIVSNSSATSFVSSGLQPETTYDFYVYSFNMTCGSPNYLSTYPIFESYTTQSCTPNNIYGVLSTTSIGHNHISATITPNYNSYDGYIVVRSFFNALTYLPVNGVSYPVGALLGSGIVVSNSSVPSFTDVGLNSGTTYEYHMYAFKNSCGSIYYTSDYLYGIETTLPCTPANQPTTFVTSTVSFTQVSASFTPAGGSSSKYLVVRYENGASITLPVNGLSYAVGASLGNGIVISNTSAASFSNQGLQSGITYNYYIYSYYTACSSINYLTNSPLIGTVTTLPCTPTNQPTAFVASTVSYTQINGSYTAATGNSNEYLVVRYANGSTITPPINGVNYSLGTLLGNGIVVSNTNTTSFNDQSLQPGMTYSYYIYSYSIGCNGINYLTMNPLTGTVTTLLCTPSNQPTSFSISVNPLNQISGSFIASISNPSNYLVVRYPSGSNTSSPIDGINYSIGSTLGVGTIISNTNATNFTDIGLPLSLTYDYYVYSYNYPACSGGPFYQINGPLMKSFCTSSPLIPYISSSASILCNGDSVALYTSEPQYYVSTFAVGSNTNGNGCLASDADGNIYVADQMHHRIRKITPTGSVSTLAGNNINGLLNGTGSSAYFNFPVGVVCDSVGNVYVADKGNFVIRKITPGGIVTTFAGTSLGSTNGPATLASFGSVYDLAFDVNGNLFVSDLTYDNIRKITPAGIVSTLAGSGTDGYLDGIGTAASFSGPISIDCDLNGNVIAADYYNNKIRKITPNGVVSTLVSTPNPSGITCDQNGNIFFTSNNQIKKISPNGIVSIIAGNGTSSYIDGYANVAAIASPWGITIDANNNLFVSEGYQTRIRKITAPLSQTYNWEPSNSLANTTSSIAQAFPTSSTTYTVTASNGTGCTSSSTATVTVKPNHTITAITGSNGLISSLGNTSVCQGAAKTYNISPNAGYQIADVMVDGISVGVVSTYTFSNVTAPHTISASFVCSSTYSNISQSFCQGNSYVFNGQTLILSGTYYDTLLNSIGCDSIITLNLTITPSTSNTTTASACDTYTWSVNNQTYSTSGNDTVVNGCHTEILDLTITPSTSNTTTASACDTYTWSVNNQIYTSSGNYSSTNGCHTEILDLTITPSTSNTTIISACDTYTWSVNNQTYTSSLNDTVVNGCHTEILNLAITPSTTDTANISTYVSYTWNVNNTNYTTSGTYFAVVGCATHILNLTINPVTTTSPIICPNSNVTLVGTPSGGTFSVPNPYSGPATNFTYTYTDINGNSSSAIGNISVYSVSPANIVLPITFNTTTATITWNAVPGSSIYYVWYKPVLISPASAWLTPTTTGTSMNLTGLIPNTTYEVKIRNNNLACNQFGVFGAPIQFTTLNEPCGVATTLNPVAIVPTNKAVISWQPISGVSQYSIWYKNISTSTWLTALASSTSTTFTTGTLPVGNYEVKIRNKCTNGLFSAFGAVTNFTICSTTYNSINENICQGSSYMFNGMPQTATGIYYDTLVNALGCDSIITLNLNVIPLTSNTTTASVCDTYTWSVNNQTYTSSANDTVVDGCQTEILDLTIVPSTSNTTTALACETYTWSVNNQTYTSSGFDTVVNGCQTEILNLTITPSTTDTTNINTYVSYTWNVNNTNYSTSGTYIAVVGCVTHVLDLTINPVTTTSPIICPNSSVTLTGTPSGGVFNVPNPYSGPATNFTYTYTASNGNTSSANGSITVSNVNPANIILPISKTATTATITWNAVPGSSIYYVWYKPVSSPSTAWLTPTTSGTSMNLAGLIPNTTYEVKIRNNNLACNQFGVFGTPVTFTTNNEPCGVAAILNPVAIVPTNKAVISWQPISGVSQYSIWYKNISTSTWLTALASSTSTTFTTGTFPVGNYEVKIRNKCATGVFSTFGSALNFSIGTPQKPIAYSSQGVNNLYNIFPNPTSTDINIEFESSETSSILIKVFDMTGRLIKQVQTVSTEGLNNVNIDLNDIPAGVYTVQIFENDKIAYTSRVSKQD